MVTYSSVDLLNKEILGYSDDCCGFLGRLKSFTESFKTTVELNIEIPTKIYLRTEQICQYIEQQVDVSFDISNFIMVLYLDFMDKAINKYTTFEIYTLLNRCPEMDKIKIVCGQDIWEGHLKDYNSTNLLITMKKKDVLKGELLLAEIDETYGFQTSFERVIEALWIEFIKGYQNNRKLLKSIIKILQNTL